MNSDGRSPTGSGKAIVPPSASGEIAWAIPSRTTIGASVSSSISVATAYGVEKPSGGVSSWPAEAQRTVSGEQPSASAAARASRFVLPGTGAEAEHGRPAGRTPARGLGVLLGGDVVEPAEVEVVTAGGEAALHPLEIGPVGAGVQQQLGAVEIVGQPRLAAAVRVGDRLRALARGIDQCDRSDLVGLGQVAHDRRRDRAAGTSYRDSHLMSSRPLSASQKSIRSRAESSDRPVSSSTRRIR